MWSRSSFLEQKDKSVAAVSKSDRLHSIVPKRQHCPAELNSHRRSIRIRLYFRGTILNIVDVTNAVHSTERIEGEVVALVEVTDFYDVLIE